MFKKKFKHLHTRIDNQEIRWRDMDAKMFTMARSIDYMEEQYKAMRIIKADMQKMDVLTAMVSELARRIDLAGVADLPSECVCEACGCKK